MPRKKKVEEAPVIVEETPVVEKKKAVKKYGLVTGCERLNIRFKPTTNELIDFVAEKGTKFEIKETDDPEWLQVRNKTTGYHWRYAMAKFISPE